MKGGIYQDKKRPGSWIVRFPGVSKRVRDHVEAERFLNMLRYKYDQGEFDEREFKTGKPLGFRSLSDKWLSIRENEVRCKRNLVGHIRRAQDFFDHRFVRDIKYGDIEDYIQSFLETLSRKTVKNYITTLHAFWTWLIKRREVDPGQIPAFPDVPYELGWRKTVDKTTQARIIAEVKGISYDFNPKIWIGVKWLSTYVSIRPNELRHIKEGDFDFGLGTVNVTYNKERKPKIVPMLPEDLEIVRSFGPALPHLYFFRHGIRKGVAVKNRGQFGKDYLYTWWRRACKNIGIEGVDLYGGTRHSSVKALRSDFRPDEIKRGTMHHTNSAFERYFQVELEDARKVYRQTSGSVEKKRKGNVVNLFGRE